MTDVTLVPAVRELTAADLGIGSAATIRVTHASNAPDAPGMAADDPLLQRVIRLLPTYGGVIFSGPPGTGKTFTAALVAEALAGGAGNRVSYVQFHASFQYDDFMEGFVPRESGGGFERKPGVFLRACAAAQADPDNTHVLVIDELSRADAARVFGEALTYVERSKRGLKVTLASGTSLIVPDNLVILATMNPIDRGVDEVDAAFERRFAKISVDPDRDALAAILDGNGLEEAVRNRVIAWFSRVNAIARNRPAAAIGHAYFISVDDPEALRDLWEHQLKFAIDRAFRLDAETKAQVENDWKRIFVDVEGGWDGSQIASAGVDDTPGDTPSQ